MAVRIFAILIMAGAWLGWEYLPQPQSAPADNVVARTAGPPTPRDRWAVDLLGRLGNAQPSAATVRFLVQWSMAEDSGGGAFARNNPLNSTQPGHNETMSINDDGVRGYATYQDGLDATVQTITNGLYNDVVAALLANDPESAKRALWASPWASSHYGYGSTWPVQE